MDQKFIDLFDRYTHGAMTRRQFLDRLAVLAGSTAAATALLPVLENNYAVAQTVPETDPRLVTETVAYPTGAATVSGYLVKPRNVAKAPIVMVIHENRGLNPHIRDVTRRLALEGFIACGVDYLSPLGGTPEDADKARDMIGTLKPDQVVAWGRTVFGGLVTRPDSNGRVGAVGFCWGGAQVNALAVAEPYLAAGVAYYGRQPPAESVPDIRAPLLLHYAGLDQGINAGIPAFEAALKATRKTYELHLYEGVNHAFNNDTNAARYDKAAADLAWSRTVAFLKRHLA